MFTVDDLAANAIRRACGDCGELAGVVELRRHYQLLTDNTHARQCVRMIAAWQPLTNLPVEELRGDRGGSSRS